MKLSSPTPLSRGEFGVHVGLPRILYLLEKHSIKATFFTPAHTATSFPGAVRSIQSAGHEIGLHGDCHENPVGLSKKEEASLLDSSISKISSVLGENFKPKGYRSPAWDLTDNTISLLQERGLLYDSSMMGDDFSPYYARTEHHVSSEDYNPGRLTDIVEIPVAWELDDFPHFMFLNRPLYLGLRTTGEVFDIWRNEFDFCNQMNGTFTLTLHPQIIGRGPRILMLEKLITYIKGNSDVRFSTCQEEVLRWKKSITK